MHLILIVISGLPYLWNNPTVITDMPPIKISLIKPLQSGQVIEPAKQIVQEEQKNESKINKPKEPTKKIEKAAPKKKIPVAKQQTPPTKADQTNEAKEISKAASNEVSTSQNIQSSPNISENSEESINYEKALIYLLSKAKKYPERARRRGITGDGTIRLKINKDGSINYLQIAKSTGSEILDQELLLLVKRASPLPPVPVGVKADFLIPVRFALGE